jgi:acyl-CoA thioesterase
VIIGAGAHELRLEAIDPSWCVWDGVHGGYALAVAAKVAEGGRSHPPRALHGTFLAPVPPGQMLDVCLTDLRRGRSSTDVRVEVHAGSLRTLDAVATFDRWRDGPSFERFPFPEVPPPGECEELALLPVGLVSFMSHLQVRPTTDATPLAGGPDPELCAWVRLLGGDLSPWQVVTVLLDALPPGLYATATTLAAIPTSVMTVALTGHAHDLDPWTGHW